MRFSERLRIHTTRTRQGDLEMREQDNSKRNPIARMTIGVGIALAVVAMMAPVAQAAFGVTSFQAELENEDGTAATQAAGHPHEVTVALSFNRTPNRFGIPVPDESIRDVIVDMPAGFVGSTTAVPRCTNSELYGIGIVAECSTDSQVGMLAVEVSAFNVVTEYFPIYNLVPAPGTPASFGANVLGVPVYMDARIRSESDYGVSVEARETNQTLALLSTTATFWGVPADPSHDDQRCYAFPSSSNPNPGQCEGGEPAETPRPANIPAKPLLTNTSDCAAGAFLVNMKAESWAGSTDSDADTLEEGGSPIGISGCNQVRFEPTLELTPESSEAGKPTGIEVRLAIPQYGLEDPDRLGQAPLKDASVTLPPGMTVNASSADGLVGCSEAEARLGSAEPAACPAASQLGTVEVKTPLLATPLQGSVYLATQGTNPFNSLIALYISVDDPLTGVVLKIPGEVSPDPASGRLTVRFDDAPQLPFTEFTLELKGGNRAALVNPSTCGTYSTQAELTGWANPQEIARASSSFTIDQNCDAGTKFAPGFEAGTANPVAGKSSPFTLRVTRADGEQDVSRIETTLPEGLLAKLAGVPLCGDSQAATGSCPASSQVGTTTVGAGAGSNPLYVPGPGKAPTGVHLAGPYKGAPYSLVVQVPAQAGPFDLGQVTVRNTIEINPVNARVTVKSDPLPQIIQGIPISYRDVRVDVTRDDFTLNPTNCDPTAVSGTIVSIKGAAAPVSSRFQAADCTRLGFKPKLSFRYKGKTHRSAHPAVTATLKARKGDANIGKAVVTLPRTQFLEQGHIRTICTRVQFAAHNCPKGSVYGYAKAWTPLLDQPLQGPVYLRSSNNTLPDLVADLNGQIEVELAGRIDSVDERMRVSFGAVPDAPVSKFVLRMQGGKKGLLVNNTELCRARPRASVMFTGQNNRVHRLNPVVKVDCSSKSRRAQRP
ncbi:MAG TPA: hypothetical protein VJU14_07795 [Solirubrobacterales bacterium]|nr:hypothetical protein [Solirubrobacterales bacterium]